MRSLVASSPAAHRCRLDCSRPLSRPSASLCVNHRGQWRTLAISRVSPYHVLPPSGVGSRATRVSRMRAGSARFAPWLSPSRRSLSRRSAPVRSIRTSGSDVSTDAMPSPDRAIAVASPRWSRKSCRNDSMRRVVAPCCPPQCRKINGLPRRSAANSQRNQQSKPWPAQRAFRTTLPLATRRSPLRPR